MTIRCGPSNEPTSKAHASRQGALLACAGPSGGVQVLDTLDLRAYLRAARDGALAARRRCLPSDFRTQG